MTEEIEAKSGESSQASELQSVHPQGPREERNGHDSEVLERGIREVGGVTLNDAIIDGGLEQDR